MLTLLLVSSQIFSQKITLDNRDTSICFNINQGRFLLSQTIQVKKLTEEKSLYQKLYENEKKETEKQKKIIERDSLSKIDLFNINKKTEEQSSLKDHKIEGLNEVIKEQGKSITRQKVYKWIVIFVSSAVVGYETYMLVIKK